MNQTIEISHQEKVEMYRMIEKERLIEMLIEANKHLSRLTPAVILNTPTCQHYLSQKKTGICDNCGEYLICHWKVFR